MSFLYDVESSSGNTGRGLIVVKVVRESVPDYPVVADTVLTAETREDFPRGVDVLAGQGDVVGRRRRRPRRWRCGATRAGVSVDGREPARRAARDHAGHPVRRDRRRAPTGEVTTYAFLRVPGDDDLSLALRAGARSRPRSTELESVSFDMATSSRKPRGSAPRGRRRRARLRRPRRGAACAVESGTIGALRLGRGRAVGGRVPGAGAHRRADDDWTYLSVPIIVHAARSAARAARRIDDGRPR